MILKKKEVKKTSIKESIKESIKDAMPAEASTNTQIRVGKAVIKAPKIDNTYKTFMIKLVLAALFLLVLFFLYEIKWILIILFFSLFLNILFSPLLNKFNKWKIPDIIWIVIIYIIALIFIFIALFAIIPIFMKQLVHLMTIIQWWLSGIVEVYSLAWIDWMDIPDFAKEFLKSLDISEVVSVIESNAWKITQFVWEKTKVFLSSGFWFLSTLTSSLASIVLVIIFTFFIALERKNIRQLFYDLLPISWRDYFLVKEPSIVNIIKDWFKTQWLLGLCIFAMTFLGLNLVRLFWVDLEWKFTLALIAWMMEFIPYIGPILSAIPALAIALWVWYKAAIVILILYIVIQQSENHILVPYVMWKSLSLSPFAVLIWMTIWASIFWIIWIIIAVPVVAVIQIFIKDYIDRNKKK